MTWEIAFLLSMILICGTAVYIIRVITEKPKSEVSNSDFHNLVLEVIEVKKSFDSLKSDYDSIKKLAEETKKLQSERNLAMGFTPRSQRNA